MPAPRRPARGRRKVKKNIPIGQAHIKTSFNNTIVSLTDHPVTSEALARADVLVRIPMNPALDSLNIATAAGIALHRLHELRRR